MTFAAHSPVIVTRAFSTTPSYMQRIRDEFSDIF